jgi:hypothetical protein
MRPDEMSGSLERYARDVAPRLRARFGGTAATAGTGNAAKDRVA